MRSKTWSLAFALMLLVFTVVACGGSPTAPARGGASVGSAAAQNGGSGDQVGEDTLEDEAEGQNNDSDDGEVDQPEVVTPAARARVRAAAQNGGSGDQVGEDTLDEEADGQNNDSDDGDVDVDEPETPPVAVARARSRR